MSKKSTATKKTKWKPVTSTPPDNLRERMEQVDSLLRASTALAAAANDCKSDGHQADSHQMAAQLRQAAIDFVDAWRALVWGAEP